MITISYPLLYYPLSAEAVLGMLVGTEFQSVDKDLNSLRKSLSEQLKRDYKKHQDYEHPDIEQAKLRIFDIKVRPTYRHANGRFPHPRPVTVPIPAVFGPTGREYRHCYLPTLQENFYYTDHRQLTSLVQYFAGIHLNRLSPEELFRLIRQARPRLDEVSLRVNPSRDPVWNWSFNRRPRMLESLAEPYPGPKARRRQAGLLPEAAWERDDEVRDVVFSLKDMRSSLLLVGPPGVGKTAVLSQAMRKIRRETRHFSRPFTFWRIKSRRITANTRWLGEWQENVELLIEELRQVNGLFWAEDFPALLHTGGQQPEESLAAFMTPFLEKQQLQIVGEVTPTELDSLRRLLPSFVDCFQIIRLEELRSEQLQRVWIRFAEYVNKNLKLTIQNEAIDNSRRLMERYQPYQSFPGKGLKFLAACLDRARRAGLNHIDRDLVLQEFIQQTGLPEPLLKDEHPLDEAALRSWFEERIVGQPDVTRQLARIVKIFKTGLNNPEKPISTLLFAGPTGVGKTAAAKALADYFFGLGQKHSPLVRIDMSEFQYPSQFDRLLGSYDNPSKLIQEIRKRPFSLLLLDEIEKAHPVIFDMLLNLLDEGRLVDHFGRLTNFRNCIIILTSNLGATSQSSLQLMGSRNKEQAYASAIRKFFRPEFVNRLDQVVIFHALRREDIEKIAALELRRIAGREGIARSGGKLIFEPSLLRHLAQAGFHEKYGARPLQRTIEQQVVQPLSAWLLENEDMEGKEIVLGWEGNQLLVVGC